MATADKTIFSLSDDCLFTIFTYYSDFDLKKLMHLEAVCKRFRSVVQMIYRIHYQELDFCKITAQGGPVTPLEARGITRRLGTFVRTLKASSDSVQMVGKALPKSMLMNCKQLEKITLYGFKMYDGSTIKRLTETFGMIKVVNFVDCRFNDNIGECLKNASQLKDLAIMGNQTITGSFLSGLRNMKTIYFDTCPNLLPEYFNSFCEANPQLMGVILNGCTKIMHLCTKTILNLQNLETLVITESYLSKDDYPAIAALPKIKILDIHQEHTRWTSNDNAQGFLEKLAENAADRIVSLKIYGIDLNESTLKALDKFTKLQLLNLSAARIHDECTLEGLSCKDTLKELYLCRWNRIEPQSLIEFIKECKCLKLLDLSYFGQYHLDFLTDLHPHLHHELEIVSKLTAFTYDMTELQEVLAMTPKIKLTGHIQGDSIEDLADYLVAMGVPALF